MIIKPNYISFKDTVARVVQKENVFYRYIFTTYQSEYDHFMRSGLYKSLVEKQLLIMHEEVPVDSDDPRVYKQLLPQQIAFQSYCYEWSFEQWKKVILAYLEINRIALQFGMILKDATPYNFYLQAGKAVMFDTTSFMFFMENDKWIAYRQFCEELLSPFALIYYNGPTWGKLYRTHLKGLPLRFVSKQLSIRSWFNLSCLLHIHIHAKYISNKKNIDAPKHSGTGFTGEKINAILSMVRSSVLSWKKDSSYRDHWTTYYENDIESAGYLDHKEQMVTAWISATTPRSLIDLGANTGRFSFLAADHVPKVIAYEFDENCVDEIEKNITARKHKNISTLIGDLSENTPNAGFLNRECLSDVDRGKSDMVLALALIHHLCIVNKISLGLAAELFRNLSLQFLIVEFVPRTDPKAQVLLSNTTLQFEEYTEENFLESFSLYFELLEEQTLQDSERKLFLFKKIKD